MPNRPLERLGTLLEARSLLGILICTFLAPFGTPKGPQNQSKIDHFLDLFLNDFWEPLFRAFGLHLGSKNTSKMRPKRGPIQNIENHRFCNYLHHFSNIRGSRKSTFWELSWYPFWDTVSEPLFHRFWSLLGTLLRPLGHPKKHPKKHLKKRPPKRPQQKPVLAREREARLF